MDLERLNAAFGSWDCAAALTELGCIAQEFGMGRLSIDTGIPSEELFRELSCDGNPSFATILKVMHALGLKLHVEAAHA